MKKIYKYIAMCLMGGAILPLTLTSCTDMGGDGVGEVEWNGSENPQSTSFRNPVWEPSLEAGTVFRGSSGFVAISSVTEWSKGILKLAPEVTSLDLIKWDESTPAFSEAVMPEWSTGRIHSLSVDFCKTFSGEKYWMFFNIEGAEGIGAAASTTQQQGPYNDRGQIELKTTGAARDPFFFAVSTNYYLCYTTDEGVYIQKLKLTKNKVPTVSGDPTLIAGPGFEDVAIFRNSADDVYLFACSGNDMVYARANAVTGPYLDKDGADLVSGGKGTLVIKANAEYNKVLNPMRGFINTDATHIFLCYNAVKSDKPTMTSGYARHPMFVQPLEIDEAGWFKNVYEPSATWISPKYE